MTEIHWVIAIIAAALLSLGLGRFAPRRKPKPKPIKLPPAPKQTANEVKNDDAKDTANAVTTAAAEHDVDPDVIADGLEWLDADGL